MSVGEELCSAGLEQVREEEIVTDHLPRAPGIHM